MNLNVSLQDVPSAGPNLPKRKVLEEEEYIDKISHLIKRDFFPDLDTLKNQSELMDAINGNDFEKAKQIAYLISSKHSQDEKSTSLTSFLNSNTSEDNSSFNSILHAENKAKRLKNIWYYDQEKKQLMLNNAREGSLLITNSDDGIHPGSNLVIQDDTDFKGIQMWTYKAKNSLMYYPEKDHISPLSTDDTLPPRIINHAGTRLHAPGEEAVKKSQEISDRISTNKAWKDMAAATPALFKNQTNTPSTFETVPLTPLLKPYEDIDPEELMTWGTPLLVDSGMDHKNPFRIPDTPKREVLANKLADSATKNLRMRAEGGLGLGKGVSPLVRSLTGIRDSTPRGITSRTPLMKSQMLSPAAQKLLAGRGDSQLRASYSSTPANRIVTPNARSSATPSVRTSNTPIASVENNGSEKNGKIKGVEDKGDVTDNLLNF